MSQPTKKKDDAYFKAVLAIARLLTEPSSDDAAHSEADSRIAVLAKEYGLPYTAVLRNVLQRVRFELASAKKTAKRPKP